MDDNNQQISKSKDQNISEPADQKTESVEKKSASDGKKTEDTVIVSKPEEKTIAQMIK